MNEFGNIENLFHKSEEKIGMFFLFFELKKLRQTLLLNKTESKLPLSHRNVRFPLSWNFSIFQGGSEKSTEEPRERIRCRKLLQIDELLHYNSESENVVYFPPLFIMPRSVFRFHSNTEHHFWSRNFLMIYKSWLILKKWSSSSLRWNDKIKSFREKKLMRLMNILKS